MHHTASDPGTTVREIRRWHLNRGFEDIGYHYVIGKDGTVEHGRELERVGAHARGYNQNSIGIAVTGDNTRPDRGWAWNWNQVTALGLLLDQLRERWPAAEICGHGDLKATECPGVRFQRGLRAPLNLAPPGPRVRGEGGPSY